MAGEISQLLVAELGIRMGDAGEVRIDSTTKYSYLNEAQVQLCNLMHPGYLTELERWERDLTLTDHAYSIASLNSGNGVLCGRLGIKKVRVDLGNAGTSTSIKWCNELLFEDLKTMENTLKVYSDTNPLYYIWGNKVVVLITTYTSTLADICYRRYPTTISSIVDPIINQSLHGALITLAESLLWMKEGRPDKFSAAMTRAFDEIETLNAKYEPAEGIGSKVREREGDQ
jgi:hypothetical protein